MRQMINVTRSSMPAIEDYMEEISSLWESRWLTNQGVKHQELERELARYLGVDNVVLYSNGHLALEYALEALDLPKGSKIITTPFTFASTTHAIVRKGFVPVFADIKYSDYTIDPVSVEALVDSDTRAILPVHVYGSMCDVDAIQSIADDCGLKVVYDAAHAFGVTRCGRSAVSYGDISMLSFHATKVFHTIEGGALCFEDSALRDRLVRLKNFGIAGSEAITDAGGNAKMNEFCAAMGLCNLRSIDAEIAKRKSVCMRYRENLRNIEGLKFGDDVDNERSNYSYMPVMFEDSLGFSRDEIVERLKIEGVGARKYFYPLTSEFECYSQKFDANSTPVAKYVSERILTLPLYADLALEDVDRICEIIVSYKK